MIGTIIRKELLVNLLSLRFVIGLVVAVLLMGVVGYVLVEEYGSRYQAYQADVHRHRADLLQTRVFSKVQKVMDLPPSPLSVFSRGVKDLPGSITISPYHVPSIIDGGGAGINIHLHGTDRSHVNPLLRVFSAIDISKVITLVLSLFALLLVFDSFSGEREQGTLKLLLSAPAGRAQLLVGKFVGAVITMALPLTVGFLVVLVVLTIRTPVGLQVSEWEGIGLLFGVSVLYLSGFIALGLLISLWTKESSSGLMLLLLTWVFVVVALPSGVGSLLRSSFPAQEGEAAVEAVDKKFDDAYAGIPYSQRSGWNMAQTDSRGGESLLGITREEAYNRMAYNAQVFPLKFRWADDRYRVLKAHADRIDSWRRTREMLIRPSLAASYEEFCSAICGTNVETFESSMARAREYRRALMEYLLPKVSKPEWFTRIFEYPELEPTPKNQEAWDAMAAREGPDVFFKKVFTWDRIAPLDLGGVPVTTESMPGLGERLTVVAPEAAMLLGLTVCFLFLSFRRVLHAPVD